MYFLITAILEPGDEVIYPNPGFPIYESLVDFLGATRVPMPLVEERGFSFDSTFERSLSPKTKLVDLNSPANPTGGVIPRADLKRIADLLRERDLILQRPHLLRIYYGSSPESITQFEGMLEQDGHPGRLFQDLLDDRLAPRLRRDAGVARERVERLMVNSTRARPALPSGPARRAPGAAGCVTRWSRSSAPPRLDRRRA